MTIMKTMLLNPVVVSLNESGEKVKNLKKIAKKSFQAIKRFTKATGRILFVISPVYPQYMENLRRENNAN